MNEYVIMDNEGFTHGIVKAETAYLALEEFCRELDNGGTHLGSLRAMPLRFSKKGVALI